MIRFHELSLTRQAGDAALAPLSISQQKSNANNTDETGGLMAAAERIFNNPESVPMDTEVLA